MDDLPRAERSVAEAQSNVTRQREIVARLERQGLDARAAQDLLARFESSLSSTKDRLTRILQDLAPR